MVHLILMIVSMLFMWQSFVDGGKVEEARWEYRLLAYVVAEGSDKGVLEAEVSKWREAMDERDLMLVNLGEKKLEGYRSLDLSEAEKKMWRTLWEMQGGETRFVLVGKDGTAKAFQRAGLDLPLFFELIDSMPMRQAEMRR